MDREKNIDESWKERASNEKAPSEIPLTDANGAEADQNVSASSDTGHEEEVAVNFLNYVTSLGFQAMIFMGDVPNPLTNQEDVNLRQAKFLIDTLVLLKEKTTGNLDKQEEDILNASIYELQMRYVEAVRKEQGL